MKRGQITVFIIVGFLIVIAVAFLIISVSNTTETKLESGTVDTIRAPFEISPIYDYIDACLKSVSQDGLRKLGEHGGYIDLKDQDYTGGRDFEINILKPYEADAVTFGVDESVAIPYWWYMNSPVDCNNCQLTPKNQPSITEIFSYLDLYVERNIESCLKNFDALNVLGYRIDRVGDIDILSYAASNEVIVSMKYPIEVRKGEMKTDVEDFESKIELDFMSVFLLAEEIRDNLVSNQSIEEITMNIIGVFSGLDSTKLPPIAAITNDFSIVTWSKTITKFTLEDLIMQYIPFIQFENTKNPVKITGSADPYTEGLFNSFFLTNLDNNYNHLKVRVLFLDWPIYLEITPSRGDLLEPSTFKDSFPYNLAPDIQTNTYEFFYDVSYPVVIIIEDENALKSQGYRFLFAYEVNIKDNYDAMQWYNGNATVGTWSFSDISVNPDASIENNFVSDTLFCNENQKIGSEIDVTVIDNETSLPIRGATVTYGCGTYKACDVGRTDVNGKYLDKIPVCIGGYLKVKHEDFAQEVIQLSSFIDGQETIEIELIKTKHFDVEVKKKQVMGSGISASVDFTDEETAIISVRKKPETDDAFNRPYEAYIMIGDNELNDGLDLVPGDYEISATLMDNNGFIIPAGCAEICDSYDSHGNCNHYSYLPDDPIEMIPSMIGGLEMNNETNYWTLTKDDIDNNDEIEMFVLRLRTPTCLMTDSNHIGLDELSLISNYSRDFYSALRPTLS